MVLEFFLDLIFPPACVTCGSVGAYICPKCFTTLTFYQGPLEIALPHSSVDALYSCTKYEGTSRNLIHTFKYRSCFALSTFISSIMRRAIPEPQVDFLVPVPLHKTRQRERGFNQSELIAKKLGERWEIPMCKALKKVRKTSSQAELDKFARIENLSDAFVIEQDFPKNSSVALIDDVTTTGATLSECAKILKANGAQKVIGITFAHTPP